MTTMLTIRDETVTGTSLHEWSLSIQSERISVRELIRSRVYQEVSDFNTLGSSTFRGLIQPSAMESTLNGGSRKPPKWIDWKRQFEHSCMAFEQNRILILVGDHQVSSLDEEIGVVPNTTVTFVKLMLLVGG